MTHEPPQDDPKIVWKKLRPGTRISAEEVREKAQKLDTNIWRMNIITAIVVPILTLFVVWWVGPLAPGPIRAFAVMMAISFVTYFFLQYKQQGRLWSRQLNPDVALTTSLAFYRREIERRYHGYSRVARFLPLMPLGIGLFVLFAAIRNPFVAIKFAAPYVLTLFVWAIWWFFHNRREARRYRRELDELDSLK
jgi:hypothetical protein